MIVTDLTLKDIERFWNSIDKRGVGECWPWQGHCSCRGTPIIDFSCRRFIAYRIAYYLHTGIDPRDREVKINCGTPGCCNPAHLYLAGLMPGWSARERGLFEYIGELE